MNAYLVALLLAQALPPSSGGSGITDSGGAAVTTTQGIANDLAYAPTGMEVDGLTIRPWRIDFRPYGERFDYVMSMLKGQFIRIQNPGGTDYTIYLSDALDFYLPTANTVLWTAQSYWWQLTDLALGTCNGAASGRIQTAAGSGGPSYCNATAWQRVPVGINASAAIDFGSIAAQTCADSATLTATNATTGTPVVCSPSADLEAGISGPFCRVSAAGTVTVRLCNITGAPIDPASVTFYSQGAK